MKHKQAENTSKRVQLPATPNEPSCEAMNKERLQSSHTNRDSETAQSAYFDHLSGKCICTVCNCGRHKCNGRYCNQKPQLRTHQTVYQQEFVPKTRSGNERLGDGREDHLNHTGDLGGQSTYKHDYPGYNSQVELHRNQQKSTVMGVPFSGLSTYQNMFLNWGSGDTAQIYPQNNPTVIKDLPFLGRSIYKDSYQGVRAPPAQSTKNFNKSLKSPLSPPEMQFQAESIAKSSYQPFRMNKTHSDKPSQHVTMNPSFKGQYNTEYIKEYDPKNVKPCPATLDNASHLSGFSK